MESRIMSLDVESNGLWGNPISIGFTLEENGVVKTKKEACYIDEQAEYDEWITENVVNPLRKNKEVIHFKSYQGLLGWFAKEYLKAKAQNYNVLYHMGHIVESNLFKELKNNNFIGEWDAPYIPIELSMLLELKGFKADSVDALVEQGLIEKPNKSKPHQALYDAEVAGRAYWFLNKEEGKNAKY